MPCNKTVFVKSVYNVSSAVCELMFGTLYPPYCSFKAVKTKNIKVAYWIEYSLSLLIRLSHPCIPWDHLTYSLELNLNWCEQDQNTCRHKIRLWKHGHPTVLDISLIGFVVCFWPFCVHIFIVIVKVSWCSPSVHWVLIFVKFWLLP